LLFEYLLGGQAEQDVAANALPKVPGGHCNQT
jgi:hypothetical protein